MAITVLWSVACSQPDQKIEGKWASLKTEGFTVYFRKDGTFDGFSNGKSFASGYYKTSGDTLFVNEPTPDSYKAIYTFRFEDDKVISYAVSDTVSGRRKAMDGHVFERIRD